MNEHNVLESHILIDNTPESAGDFINVCTNSSGPILLSRSFKKEVKYLWRGGVIVPAQCALIVVLKQEDCHKFLICQPENNM